MTLYEHIGKRVRVVIYNRAGQVLGTIQGRVADVASDVPVSKDVKKDLLNLVDITCADGSTYVNSMGEEDDSWFAVHDATVVDDEKNPRDLPMN